MSKWWLNPFRSCLMSGPSEGSGGWSCRACTYDNPPAQLACEMCGTPSGRPPRPPPPTRPVASSSSSERRSQRRTFQLLDSQTAAQRFAEIITFCKKHNEHFVDESFRPNSESIGDLPDNKKLRRPIAWMRPSEIFTEEGRQYRWCLFRQPVRPSDIQQGTLGNCWFMSSLAVLAERPDLLRKVLLTQDYCHEGVYEVRLNIDGLWGVILVDDCFPCFSDSRTMAFSRGRRNQMWVPLIEKALAKVFGSYAALTSGQAVEGLSVLTGAPCYPLHINPENPREPWDPDICWVTLLSSREAGYLMGCSCGRGEVFDYGPYNAVGLQPHHCYSILDLKEIDGIHFIRLRNPWGRYSWTGDWSDNSPLWTDGLRAILMPNGPQQGIFWMCYADFCNYFDRVDICKIRDEWSEARLPLTFPPNFWQEGMGVVKLVVEEAAELELALYQESFRHNESSRLHDRLDLCIIVMKEIGEGQFSFVASSRRKTEATNSLAFFAQTGTYLVVPVILKHWWSLAPSPSNTPPRGALAVFASRHIKATNVQVAARVLTESLIQMTLAKGSQMDFDTSLLDVCRCTYLSVDDFCGLILLVENPHRMFSVQLRLQCGGSHNVVSTRGTLYTCDTIPPRHRQIVNILTQFEGSQSYSVSYSVECSRMPPPAVSGFLGRIGLVPQDPQHDPSLPTSLLALHSPTPMPES